LPGYMSEEAASRARNRIATQCSVCRHPARAEIEFALSRHVGTRTIAARHKLGRGAARRHAEYHLPEKLKKELVAKSLIGEAALDKLREQEGLVSSATPGLAAWQVARPAE
jgi:hypothetical protein